MSVRVWKLLTLASDRGFTGVKSLLISLYSLTGKPLWLQLSEQGQK